MRHLILAVAIGCCGSTAWTQTQDSSSGARTTPANANPSAAIVNAKPATDGQVWGGLVFASAKPDTSFSPSTKTPPPITDLEKRLAKVFPWKHYQLVGQHTQDVFRQYESWVVPTSELFLKVDSKGPAQGGGINLHLQFWRQEQVLVKTDALLRPNRPLFISGPKWRDGQFLFVLQLTRENGSREP